MKKKEQEQDKVIFRVDNDSGTILALFPEIPGDSTGTSCRGYRESTQFSALIANQMHSSKPAQYSTFRPWADLLTRLGYNLVVVKRETPHMREVRKALVEI